MTGITIVKPMALTDVMLISTDVPETDYPAYAAGTTYALGARVIGPEEVRRKLNLVKRAPLAA